MTLTAVAEADHSIVTFIIAKAMLVHKIQSRGRHAGTDTTERLKTQTKLGARFLPYIRLH